MLVDFFLYTFNVKLFVMSKYLENETQGKISWVPIAAGTSFWNCLLCNWQVLWRKETSLDRWLRYLENDGFAWNSEKHLEKELWFYHYLRWPPQPPPDIAKDHSLPLFCWPSLFLANMYFNLLMDTLYRSLIMSYIVWKIPAQWMSKCVVKQWVF